MNWDELSTWLIPASGTFIFGILLAYINYRLRIREQIKQEKRKKKENERKDFEQIIFGGKYPPANVMEAVKRASKESIIVVFAVTCVVLSLLLKQAGNIISPAITYTPQVTLSPTVTSIESVKIMAEDIASGVGKVIQVAEGESSPTVIVFEEVHDSRLGQIETAIMINRLYERYGLRQIGTEGYLKEDDKLDTSWLPQQTPVFTAGMSIRSREDIIVQLLEEGEISSSEMMLLMYQDLAVAPIEVSADYYQPLDEAWSAPTIYLYKIALLGLSDEEVNTANGLIDEDKILEAVEFIISTDEWADEKYKLLDATDKTVSIEEEMQVLDEIKAKADEVGAEITDEDQQGLGELYKFYGARSNASQTMVGNVLALRSFSPKSPVAMIIGAGHTERVSELLEKQGVSFAVISSQSSAENKHAGDLGTAAYDRKTGQLSVDETGMLGALLDGRIKPKPVINQQWLRSKTQITLIADILAQAVVSGQKPPFDNVDLPKMNGVTIDRSSIEIKDGDVIFSVQALQNDGKDITIWVRAHADKEAVDQLLEMRLQEALADVIYPEPSDTDYPESSYPSRPELVAISSETIAIFSTDRSDIEKDI